MRLIMIIFIILCSCKTLDNDPVVPLPSNPIKVVVIDSGLDMKYAFRAHLCPGEHKDFTGEGLQDSHGHGTNIVGLIVNNAQSNNYCIVVIKAYSKIRTLNPLFFTEALEYANKIEADIINISGGGIGKDSKEEAIVQKLLNNNTTLIVSAGNESRDLDIDCNFYPACYDPRIHVIGAHINFSNYGKVVDSYQPGFREKAFGQTMSGTSQATAIFTGLFLKSLAINSKGR